MLKEIKERHDSIQMVNGAPAYSGITVFKEAHQDRAYLLGLVEEAKEVVKYYADGQNDCYSCSLKARDFLKKLESEGGTNENQKG
jgi:hypothetical protein